MRRIAFDWKPPNKYGEHEAPLETGHTLRVWPSTPSKSEEDLVHPHRWSNEGWNYAIVDPSKEAADEDPWLDSGGRDTASQGDPTPPIPSEGHAKAQAEEAYRRMFPIGGPGTGGHNSGIDYSDLNAFRDYL